MIPRIVRPAKGPLLVSIPGGRLAESNPNPWAVADMFWIGHVKNLGGGQWSVPRSRYPAVALNLMNGRGRSRGWGAVDLEQIGKAGGKACTRECLDATAAAWCVCRCGGRYHGMVEPPPGVVVVGALGASPYVRPEPYRLRIATSSAYLDHFGSWPEQPPVTQPPRAVFRRHFGWDEPTNTC